MGEGLCACKTGARDIPLRSPWVEQGAVRGSAGHPHCLGHPVPPVARRRRPRGAQQSEGPCPRARIAADPPPSAAHQHLAGDAAGGGSPGFRRAGGGDTREPCGGRNDIHCDGAPTAAHASVWGAGRASPIDVDARCTSRTTGTFDARCTSRTTGAFNARCSSRTAGTFDVRCSSCTAWSFDARCSSRTAWSFDARCTPQPSGSRDVGGSSRAASASGDRRAVSARGAWGSGSGRGPGTLGVAHIARPGGDPSAGAGRSRLQRHGTGDSGDVRDAAREPGRCCDRERVLHAGIAATCAR